MAMVLAVLTDLIQLIVSGFTSFATGFGTGVADLVQALAVSGTGAEGDPYHVSIILGVCGAFAGISICIGLSKFIMNWLLSLGASH